MSDYDGPYPDDALRRDLAGLSRTGIEIPQRIDDAIRDAARSTLAARRHRTTRGRWLLAGSSLAAAIAVLITATAVLQVATPRVAPTRTALRGDLDGNGLVDVLDAFLLARRIEGDALLGAGDLNDDGVVDEADVDAIAMIAVTLPEGAG